MREPLVLASASPRRQELIRRLGLPVTVQPADVDEEGVTTADPARNAHDTALLKARTMAALLARPAVIIGADTNVALGTTVLQKPGDAAEAVAMLRMLRDRSHEVHTGIVVIDSVSGKCVSAVSTSRVTMRSYSDEEIAAYVASGDPFDKAGAYAIQHPTFRPVAALDGCYAGVAGLSLCTLVDLLAQVGVSPIADAAGWCRARHSADAQLT